MARLSLNRKSGFIQRSGVMRRETLWIGGTFQNTTITGATATLLTTLSAAALALRPFTIVRTRGLVHYSTDQEAADETPLGAYGQCVVSEQASAIGVSAIPTPVTDSSSDAWFMYEALMDNYQFRSGVGANSIGEQFRIDSKAMRKVEDGFDIVTVLENAATDGLRALTFTRTLVKLH